MTESIEFLTSQLPFYTKKILHDVSCLATVSVVNHIIHIIGLGG